MPIPKRATIAPGGINMHDRHAFRKAFREPAPNDRDPNSNFRFAPEARNTMIATMTLTKGGVHYGGVHSLLDQPARATRGFRRE